MTELEKLQKTIEDAQQKLDKLVKEEKEKSEEEKFKFCVDGHVTDLDGSTDSGITPLLWKKEAERGRIFPTEALAVKYDKLITNSYKIAQAVAQLAPDYEPDYRDSEGTYHLIRSIETNSWRTDYWVHSNIAGVVTFPESIINQMVELANSGALGLEV